MHREAMVLGDEGHLRRRVTALFLELGHIKTRRVSVFHRGCGWCIPQDMLRRRVYVHGSGARKHSSSAAAAAAGAAVPGSAAEQTTAAAVAAAVGTPNAASSAAAAAVSAAAFAAAIVAAAARRNAKRAGAASGIGQGRASRDNRRWQSPPPALVRGEDARTAGS